MNPQIPATSPTIYRACVELAYWGVKEGVEYLLGDLCKEWDEVARSPTEHDKNLVFPGNVPSHPRLRIYELLFRDLEFGVIPSQYDEESGYRIKPCDFVRWGEKKLSLVIPGHKLPEGLRTALENKVTQDIKDTTADAAREKLGEGNETDTLGMTWQDVQGRLLGMVERKEPYTSDGKLASCVGCSSSTIHKAIQNSPKLKEWQAKSVKKSFRARSLNAVDLDNRPSGEDDPANYLPDDDVDTVMNNLIDQADTPEKRVKLIAMSRDERREMVKLVQESGNDPIGKEGDRLLGRKP
ncbi:MAG: hypothetical protein V1809_10455 [Planctomycetota bacterium]